MSGLWRHRDRELRGGLVAVSRGVTLAAIMVSAAACNVSNPQELVLQIEPDGFRYKGKHTESSPEALFNDSKRGEVPIFVERGQGTSALHFADTVGFRVLVVPDARQRLALRLTTIEGDQIDMPTVEPIWILLDGSKIQVAALSLPVVALPSTEDLVGYLSGMLKSDGGSDQPWIFSRSPSSGAEIESRVRAVLQEFEPAKFFEIEWEASR